MNLVWFLLVGAIISSVLGEFGYFPFGTSTFAVSLTDILVSLTVLFYVIWKVGITHSLKTSLLFRILGIFSVIGLISLILSGHFSGGIYLVRFFIYSVLSMISYSLIKEKRIEIKTILNLFIGVGIVIAMVGFIQLLIYPDLEPLVSLGYDPHKNRLVSTFLDPNFLGTYLSVTLLLAIYNWITKKDYKGLVIIAILGIAIILTFSRSAYLLSLVELLILGIFKERKILLGLVILVAVIYFAVPRFSERIQGAFSLDKSSSERIESWQKGIAVFSQKPLLGVGFNNIRYAYEQNNLLKTFSQDGGNSGSGVDSSLILVLATTGIIGFIAYISWWLLILKILFKAHLKHKELLPLVGISIIVGLLLNSQFINSLFFIHLMLMVFVLVGGLEATYEVS